MPPKGYKSITLPIALYLRLMKMKRSRGSSVAECIEYLINLSIW